MKCSAGYYAEDTCKPCAVGEYGSSPGLSTCTACDAGLSTLGKGASSAAECIGESRVLVFPDLCLLL